MKKETTKERKRKKGSHYCKFFMFNNLLPIDKKSRRKYLWSAYFTGRFFTFCFFLFLSLLFLYFIFIYSFNSLLYCIFFFLNVCLLFFFCFSYLFDSCVFCFVFRNIFVVQSNRLKVRWQLLCMYYIQQCVLYFDK